MKETLKRLTCMLLALIMVAGMFPVSVFAEAEKPISVDAGSTVSNVIGPIGAPETSQEPVVQTPVEEVVEEPTEVVPETPAFDPAEPIKYQVVHGETFSVRSVLTNAGVSVDTVTNVTGEMSGLVAATNTGDDWRLTPFNYFDALELSVSAKNSPDGEEATYTVILSNPEQLMPAVTLTAIVDFTTITVEAPEGAFPKGIQMRAAKADPADLLVEALIELGYSSEEAPALAQAIVASGEDLSAYIQNFDIAFYLPNEPWREIEPEKEVNVKFENLAISTEDIAVFSDNGVSVDTLDADVNGAEVIVSVSSFSQKGVVNRRGLALLAATVEWPEPLIDRWNEVYVDPVDPNNPEYQDIMKARYPVFLSLTGPLKIQNLDDAYIRAGETVQYKVEYGFNGAASFPASSGWYEETSSLFDHYDNVKMTITLPAGLQLTNVGSNNSIASVTPDDGDDFDFDKEHVYVINTRAGSSVNAKVDTSFDLNFQVYIGKNGMDQSDYSYGKGEHTDLGEGQTQLDLIRVHLEADWTLYDKRTNTSMTAYTSSDAKDEDATGFEISSPDLWGVRKAQSAAPTRNDTDDANVGRTVTYTWNVAVGLEKNADHSGDLYTQGADYSRYGRLQVNSITLDETLATLLNDVAEQNRELVSVKLKRTGPSNDGEERDITDKVNKNPATPITIWGSDVDEELKMNNGVIIDSDGDSHGDVITPTYTTYKVTATYRYNKNTEIVDFWEDVNILKATNTVGLTAEVAQKGTQTHSAAATSEKDLPKKDPGSFQIAKNLKKFGHSNPTPYNNEFGSVTYTIKAADGSSEIYVYTKTVTGSGETEVVTWTLVGSGTSVTVSAGTEYFVVSGVDYEVEESFTSTQMIQESVTIKVDNTTTTDGKFTSVANKKAEVTFVNRESKGAITVLKKDNAGANLDGAWFELTYPNGTTVRKQTENGGKAIFDGDNHEGLPYGTYSVREVEAPVGFTIDDNTSHQVVIDADHQNVEIGPFVNTNTSVKLTLEKYTGVRDTWTKVNTTFDDGEFILEWTTDDPASSTAVWTTAKDFQGNTIPSEKQKLNAGKIEINVAKKDQQGRTLYYRFKETISGTTYYPYNPDTGNTKVQYSDYVDMLEGPQTIKMYNRKYVTVQVYKNFYNYDTNGGTSTDSSKTVPVTLYQWDGKGAVDAQGNPQNPATQLVQFGETLNASSSSTAAKWTQVPLYYGPNSEYTYYVKETMTSEDAEVYVFGGVITTMQGKDIVTINGEKYVKFDMSSVSNTAEARFLNYRKAIPVRVNKINASNTAQGVNNCKITVYTDSTCQDIALDAQTGAQLKDFQLYGGKNWHTLYLEPGKTYYYKETTINPAFDFDHADSDSTTVTIEKGGVIDLTGLTQPEMVNSDTKTKDYSVYNKPYNTVKIAKKTMGGASTLNNAVFTVYVKNADGTYKPYKNSAGTVVTISGNATSGTALPAGTYYIAETTVPSNYLNPNLSQAACDEYNRVSKKFTDAGNNRDTGANGDVGQQFFYVPASQIEGLESGGYTFSEITVGDTDASFTYYNIYLYSTVKVQKTVDGKTAAIAGFMVQIFDGTTKVKENKTNASGIAEFAYDNSTYRVPIYYTTGEHAGEQITYTVKEGEPSTWTGGETGNLGSKYYKISDGQTFKLEPGETTTKDLTGETLTVDNGSYLTVQGTKWMFDGWQHTHGGISFPMPNAIIGLYKKAAESNTWEYVGQATTDVGGQISFDKLKREDDNGKAYEYALVELASGDPNYFPYFNGELHEDAYPQPGTDGTYPNLPSLDGYNVLPLTSSMLGANVPNDYTQDGRTYTLGDLYNANHWVQFHLTKYVNGTTDLTPVQFDPTVPHDPDYKRLNDCIYSLYRYVLNGETTVAFARDGAGWEYLNTYTTGQIFSSDGHSLDGEFLTIIDKNVNENYIYILVEDSTGPHSGSIDIDPYFEYTLWYPNGHPVTVTVDSKKIGYPEDGIGIALPYTVDMVNHEYVVNTTNIGPGESEIFLAALRLAKWRDTYDKNGDPEKEYKPLSNAEFKVYLPLSSGNVLLNTMYSGLDGGGQYALAQSGVYQLKFETDHAQGQPYHETGKVYLLDYEVEGGVPRTFDVTDILVTLANPTSNNWAIYGVPVYVQETDAPDGYGFSPKHFLTYLIFVDKDITSGTVNPDYNGRGNTGDTYRFFSDLYFVKDILKTTPLAVDQVNYEWYATDGNDLNVSFGVPGTQRRIVDYPMNNTSVLIHKVGYVPVAGENGNTGLDSEAIANGNFGAVNLSGVTMKIERKKADGSWAEWDYKRDTWGTGTFETDELGTFFFPIGLPMGDYRVYETDLGEDNRDAYEMAYTGGTNGFYREFKVGGKYVDIYMANPEKIDLTLKKKDMEGNTLSGVTFKLGTLTAVEGPDGTFTFENLASGTYKLTETATAGAAATLSDKYFESWFKTNYSSLAALVGNGMRLGYTYDNLDLSDESINGNGKDVTIRTITPWDQANNKILEIEIRNPVKGRLNIKKVDLDDNSKTFTNGVAFDRYYMPFKDAEGKITASGPVSVTLPIIPDGTPLGRTSDTSTDTVRGIFNNAGWQWISNQGPSTINNLEPGIYVFYENAAPTGYDRLVVGGNVVLYTAVVKCGLPVQVTVTPSKVTLGSREIQTNFESDYSSSIAYITAQDPKKATLKALKTVEAGALTNDEVPDWKVILNVYDSKTASDPIATATIVKGQTNPVQFTDTSGNTVYFTVGKSYYLEEVVDSDDEVFKNHFVWVNYQMSHEVTTDEGTETVTDPAVSVTPGSRYEITFSSASEFTVTATNQYRYGKVVIVKFNADKTDQLTGATFEVRLHPDDEDPIEGSSVTESTTDTGVYTAWIPLVSAEETTYYIVETDPPEDFVLNPDPTKNYITVALGMPNPENPSVTNVREYKVGDGNDDLYLTNEEGSGLTIIKFNNAHGSNYLSHIGDEEIIRFSLYHKGTDDKWTFVEEKQSETGGKIVFDTLLAPYEYYAVAETYWNTGDYKGIESMWRTIDGVSQKLDLEDITVGTNTVKNAYIFQNVGDNAITVDAYNIPIMTPKIVKLDVGNYPDGVHPKMNFSIYEVDADFDATGSSARTNVEGLAAAAAAAQAAADEGSTEYLPRLVFSGVTGSSQEELYQDGEGYLGTFTKWIKTNTDQEYWDPAKTYILVETEVGAYEVGVVYDTMVKDDPRVVWFTKIDPVNDPNPDEPPVFTLKNINGVADVDLTKSIIAKSGEFTESDIVIEDTKGYVDSLITGSRKVAYTLTPEVSGKNQMLRYFELADSGLTATPATAPFTYGITSIKIGEASQNVDFLKQYSKMTDSVNATITAELYLDGSSTYYWKGDVTAADPDNPGTVTVDVPDTTQNFVIRYYSPEVKTATRYTEDSGETMGEGYLLGEEFKVGPTQVLMTVDQITASATAVEITEFLNRSSTTLVYPKWEATGAGPVRETDDAQANANVYVHSLKLPVVSIEKDNNKGSTAATGTEDAPSYITYSITIKNNSTDPDADFDSPVVIDILPTGVKYYTDSTHPVTVKTGTEEPYTGDDLTLDAVIPVEGTKVQQTNEGDYRDPETALIFKLNGALKPGYTAVISFSASITESALLYDKPNKTTTIRNDAYLSSSATRPKTEHNPNGWAWAVGVDESGEYVFGDPLTTAAIDPDDPVPALHEKGVRNAADMQTYENGDYYVWIRAMDEVAVVKGREISPQKGVRGDQDSGFHDDGLGWATRTKLYPGEPDYYPGIDDEHVGDMGHVDWRLAAANGDDIAATKLVVGDAIAKVGDGSNRGSNWNTIFGYISDATVSGVDTTDYTIWVIRSPEYPTSVAENKLEQDMPHAREADYLTNHGWTQIANSSADNFNTIEAKSTITAFMLVFGEDVVLEKNHSLVVTYRTYVEKMEDDADFFGRIAFTNAVNRYKLGYAESARILSSNPVSVSVLDGLVAVEGDVWIDENWDATQYPVNTTGNRRDYSQYPIIDQLADGILFNIYKNFGLIPGSSGGNDVGGTNTAYGESIKHFKFENLTPSLKNGDPLYIDEELNVAALKGSDPANYWLEATINGDLLNIFQLTDYGSALLSSGPYMSDDPATLIAGGENEANARDNNFHDPSGTGAGTNYKTKPFYLRYSTLNDQSKDIGFRMVRGLELTKVALDDPSTGIAGAKFQIYGPFGDRAIPMEDGTTKNERTEATASGSPLKFTAEQVTENGVTRTVYTLNSAGTVTDLVTDDNGKIYIQGLNWWKEYDIKEIAAGDGYQIAGATAEPDSRIIPTDKEDVFTLLVPTPDRTDPIDKVTVKNPRTVEVQLEVEKILKMYSSEEMTFDFSYWLTSITPDSLMQLKPNSDLGTSEDDPIQTIHVIVTGNPTTGVGTAIGNFDTITLNGAGTYVFSIKEIAGNNPNVKYDTATKTATVVVVWDNDAKKLVVKSIIYSDPVSIDGKPVTYTDGIPYIVNDQGQSVKVDAAYEGFTNEYESKPVKATPHATKSISGEPLGMEKIFTFSVTATSVVEKGAYIAADPDVPESRKYITTGENGYTVSKQITVKPGQTVPQITFDEITYILPGTYTYTIKEETPSDDNFTCDTTEWIYTVVVAYNQSGNLAVTETYQKKEQGSSAQSDPANFDNKYTPKPVDWYPQAKKIMKGEPIPNNKSFIFELTEVSDPNNGAVLPANYRITVTVEAGHKESDIVQFADTVNNALQGIVFSKAGTYDFQVAEEIPDPADPHIDYTGAEQGAEATFTVTVVDDNGQLKVTNVTPKGDVDQDGITVTAKFTNKYTVEPTLYQPKIHKIYSGAALTADKNFYFELKADPYDENTGYNPVGGADFTSTDDPKEIFVTIPAGSTEAEADKNFPTIHYTKAGTYTYTATEQDSGGDGFKYSGTVWTLTVVVEDPASGPDSGKLTVKSHNYYTPADENNQPQTLTDFAKFRNSYETKPTTYTPDVEKTLVTEYGPTVESKTFHFTMELKSQKDLNGNNITDGAFIRIPDSENYPNKDFTTVVVLKGETNASASFGEIRFEKSGIYVLEANELIESEPGIIYQNTVWTLTVRVEDNLGQLNVISTDYKAGTQSANLFRYSNTYKPEPTKLIPKVSKKLTQSSGKTDKEKTFNFTLQAYADNNPNPAGGATIRVQQTLPDGTKLDTTTLNIPIGSEDEKTADFGEIKFEKAGTYKFLIKEKDEHSANESITYDPAEWTLTVVVVDKNGKLEIDTTTPPIYESDSDSDSEHAKFINNYVPKPTDLTLPVKKTLEGNNPPEEVTFTFTMSGKPDNNNVMPPMPEGTGNVATVTMTTAGDTKTTNFGKIVYTSIGEYKYTVVETVTTAVSGMKYDKAEYTVTVNVKCKNDKLFVETCTIEQTAGSSDGHVIDPVTKDEILFTNTYTPKPVTAQLHAKKHLTGETWPSVYENKKFTFTERYLSGSLTGFTVADGLTQPTQTRDAIETIEIKGKEAISPDGKIADFSEFKFTEEGTYVFEITENVVNPDDPNYPMGGVAFDTTVWEVTVKIKDDHGELKIDGKITYTPMVNPEENPHQENYLYAFFTNGYDNGTVPYTPQVTKRVTMDYGPLVKPRTFNFELAADENNPAGASLTSQNGPDRKQIIISANEPVVTMSFKEITFTADGTYNFTATETAQGEGGIIYSGDIWTLTVVVEDEGGKLTETHSYSYVDENGVEHKATEVGDVAGPTFTNKYEPKPTNYQPKVKKTVPGNRLPVDKEFEFTLTLTSQPNTGDPTISGVRMNGSPMAVNDTDSVKIKVLKGSTGATEIGYFKNLEFVKAGTYTFTIAENTPSGLNGITDDTTVWTLTVEIEDLDGVLSVVPDPEYKPNPEDQDHKTNSESANFSNPYKPEPTEFTPKGIKTIEAEFGPTVEKKIFTFDLKLDTATATYGTETDDVKDGADIQAETKTVEIAAGETTGEIPFSKITFSKEGTYTYKIQEKVSREEGITDDTREFTLEIVVKDKDGALYIAEYTYSTKEGVIETKSAEPDTTPPLTGLEAETGVEVKNIYKPEPTHYQPLVDKKMTTDFGPTVEDKTFNFTLTLKDQKDAADKPMTDGAVIPTDGDKVQIVVPAGKNNASGAFGEIEFVKAGTYVFEVKEVKESETGITYDGATWTLTVVIEDLDGKLSVKSTEYKPDPEDKDHTTNAEDGATFTNPYKPDPTQYTPQVIKDIELVTGAPTTLEKHFTFDLKFYSAFTDDWEKLDAYQLDAAETDGGKQFDSDTVTITIPAGETHAGPIPFKTIHFTRAGRYTYKITERVTIPELGMTYDQAEWTLTVIVRDADGKLEIADANYTSNWTNSRENREAAKFVNPYTTGNLRVTKRVSGTGASTSTKFTFKVTLYTENVGGERTPLPGTYPVEIYNNKTGELVDTATVENGTATFKLKHEQTAIIRNIPVGVKWEVEEERAFGYATSAETPNKGTIQKGENISNWKNHRSTVPPIPRTGYGDGTTVKVGLGTSLGVFLASAIGSILQSKNAKKKKRGGGSHAAN